MNLKSFMQKLGTFAAMFVLTSSAALAQSPFGNIEDVMVLGAVKADGQGEVLDSATEAELSELPVLIEKSTDTIDDNDATDLQ